MYSKMKRGFTLIELLVVIAIIAILAAILFPVFAQARAKARQTACLSNYKQNALSFLQYAQDYDEHLPQAQPLFNGKWNYYFQLPVPANLYTAPPDPAADQALYASAWANEIQPYAKNVQVLDCSSAKDVDLTVGFKTIAPAPRVALEFNGLLTSYPLAGMPATASVILMWNGDQKIGWVGGFTAEPQLWCPKADQPCVYKPSFNSDDPSNMSHPELCPFPSPNSPTDSTLNGATSVSYVPKKDGKSLSAEYSNVWIHGAGDNFGFADGHAKWRPLGSAVPPARADGRVSPYAYIDSNGNTTFGSTSTTLYVTYCQVHYLFRPDYQK